MREERHIHKDRGGKGGRCVGVGVLLGVVDRQTDRQICKYIYTEGQSRDRQTDRGREISYEQYKEKTTKYIHWYRSGFIVNSFLVV